MESNMWTERIQSNNAALTFTMQHTEDTNRYKENIASFSGLRYCGCFEIYVPTRSLDFATRSKIVRECIHRLSSSQSKPPDRKSLRNFISSSPCLELAGSEVSLYVTSSHLEIITTDYNKIVARHEIPFISFCLSANVKDTFDENVSGFPFSWKIVAEL